MTEGHGCQCQSLYHHLSIIDTNIQIMSCNRFFSFCPRCKKKFKDNRRVLQHMNQPNMSCLGLGFIDDIIPQASKQIHKENNEVQMDDVQHYGETHTWYVKQRKLFCSDLISKLNFTAILTSQM